jgi:type II secretory pathway pseudopilin PulG
VVAIIAVLAALLLPALTKAKERANRAVCVSNLKQVGIAAAMYTDDHDEWLPINSSQHWYTMPRSWPNWFKADYAMGADVRHCPSSDADATVYRQYGDYMWYGGGFHTAYSGPPPTETNWSGPVSSWRPYRLTQIIRPDRWGLSQDINLDIARASGFNIYGTQWNTCWWRENHCGGMNTLLLDGQVRWYANRDCDLATVYGNWPGILFARELPQIHGNASYHVTGAPGGPMRSTYDNADIVTKYWSPVGGTAQ